MMQYVGRHYVPYIIRHTAQAGTPPGNAHFREKIEQKLKTWMGLARPAGPAKGL